MLLMRFKNAAYRCLFGGVFNVPSGSCGVLRSVCKPPILVKLSFCLPAKTQI